MHSSSEEDRSPRRETQKGFTLIEIMVATLLLLVAMAGFVPIFLSGLDHSSLGRYRSVATNIARQRMEQVRQMDYREIQEATGNPTDPRNLSQRFGTTVHVTDRNMNFNVAYAVNTVSVSGSTLESVKITVSWAGRPASSPIVVQTLISQQYLGPRGILLDVTSPAPGTDPLGTPFPLLQNGMPTVKYYIAPADWGLVYGALNPASSPLPVYMRLAFVDDNGIVIPMGNSSNNYKITTVGSQPATGPTTDVWFTQQVDVSTIPDGYWNLQAVAYNQFDEPGNVWTLRVRVEKPGPAGIPAAPTNVVAATDLSNNHRVTLTWTPGSERDRAYWVIERKKRNPDGTWPAGWTIVNPNLAGNLSTWVDDNGGAPNDPWGDGSTTNYYEYLVYAVDIAGNFDATNNSAVSSVAILPAPPTTTTTVVGTTTTTIPPTTTTTVPPTTTTTTRYTVTIANNDTSNSHTVTVKDSGNTVVYGPWTQIKKKKSDTVGLFNGSYNIYIDGNAAVLKSFTVNGSPITVDLF
ncbi:MAG: prepilin-type N-terminal cleavage/methylation domain-containing protein [Actinobacteria bacterium]|nr:prepilin-type N-terminal cleavage/methylation domain-containing protein [Actinomycetota bacterium]